VLLADVGVDAVLVIDIITVRSIRKSAYCAAVDNELSMKRSRTINRKINGKCGS